MLRKCVWVPVAAIVLALLPTVANAQFQQGDWELTLAGNGQSDNDFDATSLSVAGSLGYFFTDQIEAGLRQAITYVEAEDDAFAGATSVFADFHFDLDRWQPFIGAQLGYIYGDFVNDTFVAGPEGGVKYFVNNTTFIFATVQYQFFFDDEDDAGDAIDDGQWIYGLGIGFRW